MWTKKGKYGLKALLYLSALPPARTALCSEIAAAHALPQKFLEAILLELRNAGFVRSRQGKGGGYALAVPAREIFIGDVVRALEGPLAPIPCASARFYERCADCPDEQTCAIHFLTQDVRNAIAGVLDATSVEDMRLRLEAGAASAKREPRRNRLARPLPNPA
jgi:Rrf2 family protein